MRDGLRESMNPKLEVLSSIQQAVQFNMIGLVRVSRAPQCLSCLRQAVGTNISESAFPFHRQLRGKKSAKQPATITVKLLEDIRGYGRKGQLYAIDVDLLRLLNVKHRLDHSRCARQDAKHLVPVEEGRIHDRVKIAGAQQERSGN